MHLNHKSMKIFHQISGCKVKWDESVVGQTLDRQKQLGFLSWVGQQLVHL